MSTVTMRELELETAELLPPRETLCGFASNSNYAAVGSGDGNTEQFGLVNVSVANGNLDGDGNLIEQIAGA